MKYRLVCFLAATVVLGCPVLILAADAPSAPASPLAPVNTDAAVNRDNVVVDEKTDVVIKGALKYLAIKQTANGSWTSGGNEHAVAITAYTLMAFLAAGNVPGEGEYGRVVGRGTQYLVDSVNAEGFINANNSANNMYGHGIATIALGEIYGQSRDPKLRPKLEAAIKLIIKCQNQQGGWRYQARVMDGDISVTVLQCVALRAAKNAGVDVPQATIDQAVKFVKACYDANSGGFCYQPHSGPGFARTAAAVYSLQVCGLYDDPMVKKGAVYLMAAKAGRGDPWLTYGHFYAAPAMYMIGGSDWKDWYETIQKTLVAAVKRDAELYYWDPLDGKVGQVYATSVYTTILAMPYHYIPLYQR